MQPVQTLSRLGVPFTVARTRWMLGSKRRLVILRDHGRLLPKPGFLAQMSQTAATVCSWRMGCCEFVPGRTGGPRGRSPRVLGNRTRISDAAAPAQTTSGPLDD